MEIRRNAITECPALAAYGITTGDSTINSCADHALTVIDRMAPPGQKVMVYQIQNTAACQFRRGSFFDR